MTRKRLSMITPSSDSVLEPPTSAMMAGVAGITAHFSRFRVTEICPDAAALNQFDASVMLRAADLLAEPRLMPSRGTVRLRAGLGSIATGASARQSRSE
jgi:maleate isomerase